MLSRVAFSSRKAPPSARTTSSTGEMCFSSQARSLFVQSTSRRCKPRAPACRRSPRRRPGPAPATSPTICSRRVRDLVLDRLGVLEALAGRRCACTCATPRWPCTMRWSARIESSSSSSSRCSVVSSRVPPNASSVAFLRAAAELAEIAVVDRVGERLLGLAAVQRAVVGAPVGARRAASGSARWDRSAPCPCRRASRSRGRTCARTPRRSCSACRSARPARRPGRWGRTRSPRPSCTRRSRSRPSPARRRSPCA